MEQRQKKDIIIHYKDKIGKEHTIKIFKEQIKKQLTNDEIKEIADEKGLVIIEIKRNK